MIDSQQSFLSRDQILEEIKKSSKFKGQDEQNKEGEILKKRKVSEIVWIKHPTYDEGRMDNQQKPFYLVQITEDHDDKVYCRLAPGETSKDPSFPKERQEYQKKTTKNYKLMDYSGLAEQGIKDMTELDELNHATVLRNLYTRYLRDEIYTYVGETLLAVNPFKPIKNKVPKDYYLIIEAGLEYYEIFKSLDPHTYSIAAYALKQLMTSGTRQAIVISGESGAGKTESAKQCMGLLTSLGVQESGQDMIETIGDKILKTNPVLEAFGNSRTARNNNSSRFGKYVKMYFDQRNGRVLGARIQNYLLEKSRVTGCLTDKERNYHVFFFLLRGVDDKRAQQLGFMKPDGKTRKSYSDFKCLKLCADLGQAYDLEEYEILRNALIVLFSPQEIDAIERICAACVHIGELEVEGDDKSFNPNTPVTIKQAEILQLVANLLEIKNSARLVEEIVHKGAFKDVFGRTPDKPSVVQSTLGSLAKALYDNLFNWLVAKMNESILPQDTKNKMTIGLLDIFGFENFQINQFEQLCINFVNEKLHNLYISSVFGAEKKEMEREQLPPEKLKIMKLPPMKVRRVLLLMSNLLPPHNRGIFDLVEDKTGQGLGQQSMRQRIDDCHAVILNAHQIKEDKNLKSKKIDEDAEDDEKQPIFNVKKEDLFSDKKDPVSGQKLKATKFTISHSAKPVTYDSENFIERNADAMSVSLNQLLQDETGQQISDIYTRRRLQDDIQQSNGKPAPKSIWGKFRIQIESLMDELAEPLIPKDLIGDNSEQQKQNAPKKGGVEATLCEKTDLHFIRCLKPRDKKECTQEEQFVHAMTLQQITYMGVLESIRVKQENYPYRFKFEDFYRKYELLSTYYSEGRYDLMSEDYRKSKQGEWKERCQNIIQRVFQPLQENEYENYFAIGFSKIMLFSEAKAVIDRSNAEASQKYDKLCKFIKRSFFLRKANKRSINQIKSLIKIQKWMKQMYLQIQLHRAHVFQEKMLKAIIEFKTEKRKEQEEDAGKIVSKVYKKNAFREHLFQAIQTRKFVVKSIHSLAIINRYRKMWICRRAVMMIFDRAFRKAKLLKEEEAIYRIQRVLRGHKERSNKQDLVIEAIKHKIELKQHVSAKRIQKRLKGLLVRKRIYYLNKKVSIIQASLRAKWTRRVYLIIKKNVIILQKAYRRYMARRDQIKIRLKSFLTQELQVLENIKAMEYSQLHGHNVNRTQSQQMGLLKTLTPFSLKKINFFTRVIDLNVLVDLSDIYANPWSSQWTRIMAENTINDTPIMSVSAGQTHSLIVNSKGKVFTWGWNDNGQCAQHSSINEVILNQNTSKNAQVNIDSVIDPVKNAQIKNQGGIRIKQALAVQDRCILLIQDTNEIVSWGGNERGQLGIGHYEDVFKPCTIESLSKNDIKIIFIAAGGDLNLACSEKGDAFAWPFIQNGLKQSIPIRMPFSDKTKIQKVSCGHNFGFFISNQGLVYSIGEDNQDGQLGLGHNYPTEYPEIIQCFRDIGERIETIECGYKHAIAKSSLGKIFTWGSSNRGQLGHEHFDSELSPRILQIDKQNNKKVAQIAAGYSHSMVMLEPNKEIYWFGTCGNLTDQANPILFDFPRYLPDLFGNLEGNFQYSSEAVDGSYSPFILGSQQQDFAIVKINCSWSKTMSISNMLIADLRAVNQETSHTKLVSTLKNLGSKWDPKDIMPPYIDVISGMFPANIMRRPTILKNGHSSSSNQNPLLGKQKNNLGLGTYNQHQNIMKQNLEEQQYAIQSGQTTQRINLQQNILGQSQKNQIKKTGNLTSRR